MTRRKKIETNEAMHTSWSEGPDVEWEDPTFDSVAEVEATEPEIDLSVLTEKQRFVIECSFGLGRGTLTEREIAGIMGISQPAVHRLKEKGLKKLHEQIDS